MENDHEGAQPNQPSSPTSQQNRRRREEPDSNQSNQRRRIDDTSATDDDNNSSRSSRQHGNLPRSILQFIFQALNNRQPSSPTSQQLRRQREEHDSNQSDQRRRIDDTSATDDNNNSSRSSSSRQGENLARILPLLLQTLLNTHPDPEEDALHDNVNDGDETVEEHSLVSDEGLNSNIQDDQNQQEPGSNQSNQRRRIDDTYATDDDNNSSNRHDVNLARSFLQLFLPALFNRQLEEEALHDSVNDGDETVEEDSLVSDEGLNSNIEDHQNQQGASIILVLRRGVVIAAAVEERIGMVQRGLSKETISSHLKTRVHTTSTDSMEEETEICTICLDGYENKGKIATLDCKHEYHEDCITQWLVRKNVCPICKRQGLAMGESKKEEEVNEC
ncbi:E3 ubiquitin-protein ligase RNF6-like [Papaver somniferum]|uniref:E3 ubiquitin-protein ligase RNF6-like n=1 Tax=Papaver somniferum TaxID=3469 RepID=UPI000E7030AD|nr:E3 ubiquitin-protein ligase RNF6-like [Papaver somniferum]